LFEIFGQFASCFFANTDVSRAVHAQVFNYVAQISYDTFLQTMRNHLLENMIPYATVIDLNNMRKQLKMPKSCMNCYQLLTKN
jgi:hypothetical protein